MRRFSRAPCGRSTWPSSSASRRAIPRDSESVVGGKAVRTPLIVELFRALPEPRQPEDADYWDERLGRALEDFRREVSARYSESTLQRLLSSADPECRRAAV